MPGTSLLAARQNDDGGWPYAQGSSCTEPTVYALLALAAGGDQGSPALRNGIDWLLGTQRPDGGWAPRPSVEQSTWVTALVWLLPDGLFQASHRARAADWLLGQTGRESAWTERLRGFLIRGRLDDTESVGWAWFPGTAAWVIPTSLSLLALEKARRHRPDAALLNRCHAARRFLLSRTCRDGGWNHGSTRALGYDSDSYPETTGLALLALHAVPSAELARAFPTAEKHLQSCSSLEAESWLRLGLLAHGRTPPTRAVALKGHGGTQEIALAMLAEEARHGRNLFLE